MHLLKRLFLQIAIHNVEWHLSRGRWFSLSNLTVPFHLSLGCKKGGKERGWSGERKRGAWEWLIPSPRRSTQLIWTETFYPTALLDHLEHHLWAHTICPNSAAHPSRSELLFLTNTREPRESARVTKDTQLERIREIWAAPLFSILKNVLALFAL